MVGADADWCSAVSPVGRWSAPPAVLRCWARRRLGCRYRWGQGGTGKGRRRDRDGTETGQDGTETDPAAETPPAGAPRAGWAAEPTYNMGQHLLVYLNEVHCTSLTERLHSKTADRLLSFISSEFPSKGNRNKAPGAREQGRGNYFEVCGETSPGVQGNRYRKLKTPRIRPTIFWEGTQVHVQKK